MGQATLAKKVADRQKIGDLAHSSENRQRLLFNSQMNASSVGSSMVGAHINVLVS
jgi:hypothetical protein